MSDFIDKARLLNAELPPKLKEAIHRGDYDVEEADITLDIWRLRKHISSLVGEVASGTVIDNTALKCASDTLSQLMKLKDSLGKTDKLRRVSEQSVDDIEAQFGELGDK